MRRGDRPPFANSCVHPPPSLHRAVVECTQPYASSANEGARAVFESYLEDASTVDLAYGALLQRADTQRAHSIPGLIPKCLALLKRYLIRYIPSATMLQGINFFCTELHVQADHGGSHDDIALRKTLGYICAILARQSRHATLLPASMPQVTATPGRSSANTPLQGSFPSTPASAAVDRTLRHNTWASVIASPASARASGIATSHHLSHTKSLEIGLAPEAGLLEFSTPRRTLSATTGSGSLQQTISVALPPSPSLVASTERADTGDLLTWRWQQPMDFLPQQPPRGSLLRDPLLATDCGAGGPQDCVTVPAWGDMQSHTGAVHEEQRRQLRRDDPRKGQFRRNYSHRLFQYRPYSQQQPLQLARSDVEVVLDMFCLDE
ncbi:hypothetical protein CYMTET_13049, partial [Cymbomonas tetramitiformis]